HVAAGGTVDIKPITPPAGFAKWWVVANDEVTQFGDGADHATLSVDRQSSGAMAITVLAIGKDGNAYESNTVFLVVDGTVRPAVTLFLSPSAAVFARRDESCQIVVQSTDANGFSSDLTRAIGTQYESSAP